MAPIIEACDLVKRFDGFTAVDHISFAVPEGVIFGFLGPNGAGKTTTIKMLTTVLAPSEGRLSIAGHDPVREPLLVRRAFGIVFQDPSLDGELTAAENMELHGVLIDTKKWREHIANMQLERDRINQEIQADLKPLSRHIQVDLFGGEDDVINLDSPSQLLDAFQKLGVNVTSTGEAVLKTVDHPLAKKILDYRGYEKLISAFGESLLGKINPVTGRLHPDFLQLGADTGRFACSNPNLQQIPQDASFRNCFIASP